MLSSNMSRDYQSVFITGLIGFSLGAIFAHYTVNNIPAFNRVQQGYAVPSKLEIELQDLDKDGEKETILKYKDSIYFLKVNSQGKIIAEFYK